VSLKKENKLKRLSTKPTFVLGFCLSLLILQSSFAASCPSKTKAEWLQVFKEEADKLGGSKNYYNKDIAEYASKCMPTWNVMGLGQCSKRIAIASEARFKTKTKGGSMGWEMSDKDYVMNIPKEFRSLPLELSDGLPANYREIAKNKGWKVFKYRSRTVPNPPRSSYNRVLIVVPGPKDDKYIQFTISDDLSKPNRPEQLIDFISVEHNKNDYNKNAQVHFTQFWRNSSGKKPVDKIHTGQGYDSCYSCHPNGVRELSPEPGSYSKEDAKSLKEIKKMMSGYGKQEFNNAIHREAWGAPKGADQGCVKCHNNYEGKHLQSRGAINSRTSNSHINHKMTQDFTMPVTGLDSEKEIFDLMDNIPELLTEEERLKFHKKMRLQSQNNKFSFAVKELLALGKIDKKKADRYNLILNGSPDYPACLGNPDCFMGLDKKYTQMAAGLDENYTQSSKDYYFENCKNENLVAGADDAVEVNSSSRRGGFFESVRNFFGFDNPTSEGSEQ
jgi:hypothetical protein